MSDTTRDSLDLDDEERLPWLESADDYDDGEEYSPLRVALFVGAGLLLLVAIVGGIYWFQNRDGGGFDGTGELIAAQEGDYKVRPDDPQVRQFEGEGDASFAASEGQETTAQLGAFSSASLADSSWAGYARRFEAIGSLPKKIIPASLDGGTIYRLNAVAPSREAAQQICNNLKAAGESCLVVR